MKCPQPTGNYKWLNENELKMVNASWILKQKEHQNTGYIICCDLEYPEYLHGKFKFS